MAEYTALVNLIYVASMAGGSSILLSDSLTNQMEKEEQESVKVSISDLL